MRVAFEVDAAAETLTGVLLLGFFVKGGEVDTGSKVGRVGSRDGISLGDSLGSTDGSLVGSQEGSRVGVKVGPAEGSVVGS